MTGEGLQILTYTLHSWTLSSECSLARHTYCDTGYLREHVRLTPAAEHWQWNCHYLFLRLWSVAAEIRTLNLSWKQ